MNALPHDDAQHEDVLVSLMNDAIEFMEFDEKKSYLEAVRRCPDIVKTESDFTNFLLFEDFDIWKAVKRLLKYWDERVAIFGERAFRSLFDLTGNGALDEIDLKYIAKKAVVLLPNDKNGCAVILFEPARYGENQSNPQPDHQAFLFREMAGWQQLKEGKRVPEFGILALRSDLPRWLLQRKNWDNFLSSCFSRCKYIRYLIVAKDKPRKAWFQAIFPTFQNEVAKRTGTGLFGKAEIYCDDSEIRMKSKLLNLGFTEEGLPPSLGGTWNYDSFSIQTRVPIILENSKCRAILAAPQKQAELPNLINAETTKSSDFQDSIDSEQSKMNYFLFSAEIERIPYHQRISWINAQRNPQVVQEESFLSNFYRFHEGVTLKAAEHLLLYWSLREKLFCDRAISNMNQIGTGALDRYDRENLVSGFLMLLPKDRDGNHVLFYDPSRLPKPVTIAQKRILFYMLFIAAEQSSKEKSKVRFLIYLDKTESKRKKMDLYDVIEAFPLEIIAYHLILHQDGLTDESYRKEALSKVSSLFSCSVDQVVVHTMLSELGCNFLSDELAVYGFKEQNIPAAFGGSWNEDNFLIWRDKRIMYEASYRCQETFRTEENWKTARRKIDKNATVSGEGVSKDKTKSTGKKRGGSNGKDKSDVSKRKGL